MLDTESMLLVDDRESKLSESSCFLNQRMRADHECRRGSANDLRRLRAVACCHSSREKQRTNRERLEKLRNRPVMLLREKLGGRHERRLISILHREQRGEHSDNRLSTSDVALKQAMHFSRTAHVGENFPQRGVLRARELVRQTRLERARELALVLKSDSFSLLSRERVRSSMQQMNEQQFLECQPRPAFDRFGNRRRSVNFP